MDYVAELSKERSTLVHADRDLREGEERIAHQHKIVAKLRANDHDVHEAERLGDLLTETLHQWRRHRELILLRIAHLEHQVAVHAIDISRGNP